MKTMRQKITPHLWFDNEAKRAAQFYVSAFGADSAVTNVDSITHTPSGDVEIVAFRLRGYEFLSISAGPLFRINPSVSFIVNFDPALRANARAELDRLWGKLADGGKVLMPLDRYPFSDRYGWIQDQFGVSWQLILSKPDGERRPDITPALMFTGDMCGKAEEAMKLYTGVFDGSKTGLIVRYGADAAPDRAGTLMYADFMLLGQWFAAMDSARMHDFAFNEAVSLMVNCESQGEIDYFWKKLSAHPEAEQCGWLKDKYGLSWQIAPAKLATMLRGTPQQRKRVTQAFLKMKKFDIAELERVYEGTAEIT